MKKITVYGNGNQIREWLYVDDHCDALLKIIDNGNLVKIIILVTKTQ